jgi:hypothetical protein
MSSCIPTKSTGAWTKDLSPCHPGHVPGSYVYRSSTHSIPRVGFHTFCILSTTELQWKWHSDIRNSAWWQTWSYRHRYLCIGVFWCNSVHTLCFSFIWRASFSLVYPLCDICSSLPWQRALSHHAGTLKSMYQWEVIREAHLLINRLWGRTFVSSILIGLIYRSPTHIFIFLHR